MRNNLTFHHSIHSDIMVSERGMSMKQYCRYCAYLCTGNGANWCSEHQECRSESSCKSVNKCKDFVFCNCEPQFQDAFGENDKGYQPREHKEPKMVQCEGQLSLSFG